MPPKKYAWSNGAELLDHTRKKLDILRSYFHDYLRVKCTPINRSFKIALVDGLAGGGIYNGGFSGSPLVFLEELKRFFDETTIMRKSEGLPELSIECLFIVNDNSDDAWGTLGPLLSAWEQENQGIPRFQVRIIRMHERFEVAYPKVKETIVKAKLSNVLFNLDPCGYTQVDLHTIRDIMQSFKSPEVFFTFMIGSMLTYANWNNPERTHRLISSFGVQQDEFFGDEALRTKQEWLGAVEKIVHGEVLNISNFVSPFAINRAGNQGYNYWLLHFAKNHRAREVYNDVLHTNAGGQAHFGKSGLKMLDYLSDDRGTELIDWGGDIRAKNVEALHNELPEVIMEFGDTVSVQTLKASVYNETTAHSDDFKTVLAENRDIEVLTDKGNPRRAISTIRDTDIVRVKTQMHMFPIPQKR